MRAAELPTTTARTDPRSSSENRTTKTARSGWMSSLGEGAGRRPGTSDCQGRLSMILSSTHAEV
eukprot:5344251-Pyramimonas_sp.AAC.1